MGSRIKIVTHLYWNLFHKCDLVTVQMCPFYRRIMFRFLNNCGLYIQYLCGHVLHSICSICHATIILCVWYWVDAALKLGILNDENQIYNSLLLNLWRIFALSCIVYLYMDPPVHGSVHQLVTVLAVLKVIITWLESRPGFISWSSLTTALELKHLISQRYMGAVQVSATISAT